MDNSFFLTRLHELTKEVYTKSILNLAKAYEPYDLTPMQVRVLTILKKHGRVKVSELGSMLKTPDSNVSVVCSKLEQRELVLRVRDEKDRRLVFIESTPEADELHLKCITEQIGIAKAIEDVSDEDKIQIVEALEKLVLIVNAASKKIEERLIK